MNAGDVAAVHALGARFDRVVIDAPCTGSGTWRRRPDAKWRVSPVNLEARLAEQRTVLALGRGLVKPGGRLTYITCSLLPEENNDQIAAFLATAPEFRLLPYAGVWREAFQSTAPVSADGDDGALLLTPARHGTDGFFIAVLEHMP
jgi:16S rRNA (cytosine967-C5)-methyltransferase